MKHLNTLSSLEDELFREPRKRKTSGWWMWSVAVILGYLFVYRSTRPIVRLPSNPPPSFYDYSRNMNKEQQRQERRVADAYWQVAVHRIQASYSPDRPLPANPPARFRISTAAANLEGNTIGSRAHYWRKLREAWNRRDTWVVSRRWNTDWVESTLNSLPQYVPQWFSGSLQSLSDFFNDLAQRIPSS